jgi:hypothetical protein
MHLHDALSQIAEIRQQMARSQTFRGYRSATTAFSGLVAVTTALVQCFLVPATDLRPLTFVIPWVAAALLCLIVVGAEMFIRTRRSPSSGIQRQLTFLAVEQFMPSVVAGALVTWIFCSSYPKLIVILPGLWMILFSLGVFASARLLPRGVFAIAGFYLIAGVVTLIVVPNPVHLPLFMGSVFAIGQLALAAILYYQLERSHA